MKNKQLYILYFMIFVLIVIPVINFIKDDYGVFGFKYANLYSEDIIPNEQHFKLKFLTNPENKKFSNFIFGVSAAQAISTASFQDRENWYNISSMTFTPYEYIDTIKYLKEHNVEVKKICLLLQPSVATMTNQDAINDKKKYFMLTGFPFKKTETASFYSDYLFMNPSYNKNYSVDYLYKIKLFLDGSFSEKNDILKKYTNQNKNLTGDNFHFEFGQNNTEFFSAIKSIVNYCNQNNIELKTFISPDYIEFRKQMSEEDLAFFKKELSKITDYYDFANINEITTNPDNYLSCDHFNARIGSLIIKRMYYENKNTPPAIKGFGNYIDKT